VHTHVICAQAGYDPNWRSANGDSTLLMAAVASNLEFGTQRSVAYLLADAVALRNTAVSRKNTPAPPLPWPVALRSVQDGKE
jgi:hypothetical protein